MKIKQSIKRMLSMCPEAWYIFIRYIQLSCVLSLCAAILLTGYRLEMMGNYELFMLGTALNELSQCSLLIGVVFSFCIENIKAQDF